MEVVQAVLLEEILDYLTVPELLHVQPVCKRWQNAAAKVLERREKKFCTEVLSLGHYWEDESPMIETGEGIKWCAFAKSCEMYNSLLTWRNQWQSVPKIVLCTCLCPEDLKKKVKKNFTSDTQKIIQSWMPPSCQVLAVASIESFVCSEIGKKGMENKVEEIRNFYNIFTLSDCPGRMEANMLNLQSRSNKETRKTFQESLQMEIEDPDVKMILLFQNVQRHLDTGKNKLYKLLNDALDKNIVVIGSLYSDPLVLTHGTEIVPSGLPQASSSAAAGHPSSGTVQEIVALSFKGPYAKAVSVLINYGVNTKTEMYAELDRLKKTVESFTRGCPQQCKSRTATGYCHGCKTQMLGFMIACCARADASVWYDDVDVRNAEQEAFHTYIPNVPLLGTFGMGEIGDNVNLIDNLPANKKDVQECKRDNLVKGECTVFSVIVF